MQPGGLIESSRGSSEAQRSDTPGLCCEFLIDPEGVAELWHPSRMHDARKNYRRSPQGCDLRLLSGNPPGWGQGSRKKKRVNDPGSLSWEELPSPSPEARSTDGRRGYPILWWRIQPGSTPPLRGKEEENSNWTPAAS